MVTSYTIEQLVSKEEDWENDGCWKAEERSIAGDSDGEVGPGHWHPRLQAEQLYQQDQQSASKAERPAEDAPVSHALVGQMSSMCSDAECHTGE